MRAGFVSLLAAAALAAAAGPASAATTNVLIGATFFDPQTVTIAQGDAVTWTAGAGRHTVSSTTGAFDSGPLAEGQSFSHTFATPGAFDYRDRLNPQIAGGTVIVQAVDNAPPTASFRVASTRVAAGTAVTFDAGASADSDGEVVHHRWDFDGDGSYETDTGASPQYAKAFANATGAPRTVRVGLLVTDDRGSSAIAPPVTITVDPAPPGGPDTTPPDVTSLGLSRTVVCTRRGRGCRTPGTRLTLQLGEAARVRVVIERLRARRRPVVVRRFVRRVAAGRVGIAYGAAGLRSGRYRLTATAEDLAGNRASPVRVRFRVR